jgi:hypothetical protein
MSFLKPQNIFLYLGLIAILGSSFILDRRAPAVDEIFFLAISVFCLIKLLQVSKTRINSSLGIHKIELYVAFYFLLNCLISFLMFKSQSSFRYLLIFFTLLVFLIYFSVCEQEKRDFSRKIIIFFSIYLYAWTFYWIILAILDIDWANQQSKFIAGSSYASIVPFVGVYLLSYLFLQGTTRKISVVFWINFPLTIIASQLYDSRALYISILLLVFLLIFHRFSVKKMSKILLSVFTALLLSNMIGSLAPANSSNTYKSSTQQLENAKDSLRLIDNPRSSDQDRSHQITCATKLIFADSSVFNAFFGYGQDQHKRILLKCYGLDPSTPGSGVRPVAYAAFIVDYGALGIVCILLLYTKRIMQLVQDRNFVLLESCLTILLAWSLVTNYLDHGLLFLILFLDFLLFFKKSIGAPENRAVAGD